MYVAIFPFEIPIFCTITMVGDSTETIFTIDLFWTPSYMKKKKLWHRPTG